MSARLLAGIVPGSAQRRRGRFARRASSTGVSSHDSFVADRPLRPARYRLCGVGDPIGAGGRRRQRPDAGDRGGSARGRAGLSQPPIHDHRHRRRRHLLHSRLAAGLAGRARLLDRRCALGRHRLYRHERVGARQCAHCPGGDRLARRRARARLQGRRDHRAAGRGPGAARRYPVFRLADRTAEIRRQRPYCDRRPGRARFRRLADLDLRPSRRRHLHQGRRRRRRSCRQGRGRYSGG